MDSIKSFNDAQSRMNNDRGLGMRQGKSGGGSGRTTANTGGSMAVHDPGPKGKTPRMTNSDVRDLGKVSGGMIESPKKKMMGKSR